MPLGFHARVEFCERFEVSRGQGFRVRGLGCRVEGLECRVKG